MTRPRNCDARRHRRGRVAVDGGSGHLHQGRRTAETVAHRARAAQARDQPDKAITALARAIRRSRAGLKSPLRPVGCFFFLGPTGVGKTEVARRLAEFLFGSEKSLIRSTCRNSWRSTRFPSSSGPARVCGLRRGGQMTERVRRTPHSVILLDEIEKAQSRHL